MTATQRWITICLSLIIGCASTVWGAGERRKKFPPLDYAGLRAYTEARQTVPNYVAPLPDATEVRTRREATQFRAPPKRVPTPNLNYSKLRSYLDSQYDPSPDSPYARQIYSRNRTVRTIIPEPKALR